MFNSLKIKILLSLIIGVSLSLFIYFFVQNSEQAKIQTEFDNKSYNLLKAFESNIERNLDTIRGPLKTSFRTSSFLFS